MKRRLIIKALKETGYVFCRGDGDHDIYKKTGMPAVQVPKHKEIKNNTARRILDVAGLSDKLKK